MINYLKDCQKTTLIGQLPDIINSNNEAINAEFNWIFDSSLNRLTKSVYAPTGSVKTYFGEFTNLSCEYLTIKHVDSIQNSIKRATENIVNDILNTESIQIVMAALTNIANSSFINPSIYDVSALCDISTLIVDHNVLNDRFYDEDAFNDTNYMHDAGSIVFEKVDTSSYITVENELINLGNRINNSAVEINEHIDSSYNEVSTLIFNVESDVSILNYNLENVSNNVSSLQNELNMTNQYAEDLSTRLNTTNTSINELTEIVNTIVETYGIHHVQLDEKHGGIVNTIYVANGQPFGNKLYTPDPWQIIEADEAVSGQATIRQTYDCIFIGWFDSSNNEYTTETYVDLQDNNLVLDASWNKILHTNQIEDDPIVNQ